jgi:hypothetical protein
LDVGKGRGPEILAPQLTTYVIFLDYDCKLLCQVALRFRMEDTAALRFRQTERTNRRRVRAERIETAFIVALAGLVLFKGLPVLAGIAVGIGEMMMALARL